MKLIAFDSFKHLDYVRSVLDTPISDATGGIIAIDKDGHPQGIVLFDNWAHNSVMGHIAIQHPMAMRHLPFEALRYVFQDCDKGMFLGAIPGDKPRSLKFHLHLGFEVIYTLKDGYAVGTDITMVQMLKKNCRYLNELREVA